MAEAEREARKAIVINKDSLGAQRLLSRLLAGALLRTEDGRGAAADPRAFAAAIAQLREIIRIIPNDPEAYALLGELYERSGNIDEAIRAFTKWVDAPASPESSFYEALTGGELNSSGANARLTRALLRANRSAEAAAVLHRVLSSDPTNPRHFELLQQVLDSGADADITPLVAKLEAIIARNPASFTAVRVLARRYARTGRTDDAVNLLRAALKSGGREAIGSEERKELQIAIGETFTDALRFDEAVASYEAALLLNGVGSEPLTSDEAKSFAGEILERILDVRRRQGDWQEASAVINRLGLLVGEADPVILYQTIINLREQGKRAEALEAARKAKLRYPEQPTFKRLEATLLADSGRIEEGIRLLQESSKTGTDPFSMRLDVASLYTQAGRPREAITAAEEALKIAGSAAPARETRALLVLASARERAGDTRGAEEALRVVLKRDPDNTTALNNLGYFLVERGVRLDEALGFVQRAVKLEPFNGSFRDSLGWALYKLGRLVEAETHLTDAARRNPSSATIQEHLGDLYNRLGKSDAARSAWERAIALTSRPIESERIKAKLKDATQ